MNRRHFLQTATTLAAASALPSSSSSALGAAKASPPAKPRGIPRFGDGRDWFFEKRFGLFVHWGIYAIPGWHEQHQWRAPRAAGRVRQAGPAVEPDEVQSGRLARPDGSGGHEVHLHHDQAPRRLLPVGHEADALQHDEHAVPTGHPRPAGRGLPQARRAAVPVLLDRRLEPPELSQPGPSSRAGAAAAAIRRTGTSISNSSRPRCASCARTTARSTASGGT